MNDIRIKQIMKEEYIKCATDPLYFIKKYCYIQHPTRGRILFHLYSFQEKVLQRIIENDYTIINKSRQLGISTLAAAYALWLMLFHKDKNILCIATKQETAKNMVTKVKFMYENLPSWLVVDYEESNKLSLRLQNGSQIKAASAASDTGRSEAVSYLIVDEAAFIEGIGQIWASAQQTLSTGGTCTVISTPNGTGNWFHSTAIRAKTKDINNKFYYIELPWFVHPERDQKWRDEQDIILGDKRIAAQECDCDFSTSGHTFFPSDYIEFYEKTYIKDPIVVRGGDKGLWVWYDVDFTKSYTIIADVARGDGEDFSTAQVLDIENNIQVAEYKGQLSTREFGKFLVGLAQEYNGALLVVENSNIGWDTINTVIETGYRNFYYSTKNEIIDAESYFNKFENTQDLVPGFSMTLKVRPLLLNKFREYLTDKSVVFHSKRLLEEMKVFVWKNGKPQAQGGYNDDLIIPFAVGMYLRETSFKFKHQSEDLSRIALQNISINRSSTYTGVYTPNNFKANPYKWEIRGNQEDLNWLFNKNKQ